LFTFFIFQRSDEQLDLGLSNATYVGSSNSSLSSAGGSESPSTSMEHFAAPGAAGGVQVPPMGLNQNQHPHLLIQQHAQQYCQQDSFQAGLAGAAGSSAASNSSFWNAGHPLPVARWTLESEDEDDVNEADWSSMVAAEVLAALTDAEKKRQEIINGKLILTSLFNITILYVCFLLNYFKKSIKLNATMCAP